MLTPRNLTLNLPPLLLSLAQPLRKDLSLFPSSVLR